MTTRVTIRSWLLAAVLLLAVGGLLVSCSDDDATPTARDTTTAGSEAAEDPGPSVEHPAGSDDVVLRIHTSGGFVPVEHAMLSRPEVLVLGDGRLLVTRPEQGVESRVLTLLEGHLDEADVQRLLALAADDDLLRTPPGYGLAGGIGISDAATTEVTLAADGGTWTHRAYALGQTGQGDTEERRTLRGFVADVHDLVDGRATEPYEPDRVRLWADDAGYRDQDAVAWPVDGVDLATVGTCQVVAGDAVPAVLDALAGTGLATSFTQDGRTWSVVGAELAPGEEGCPVDR